MVFNMEIKEIIKDAFVFPSKNLGTFSIYVVLSILAGAFAVGGSFSYLLGLIGSESFLMGGIALIISMLIGWVLSGYLISVIKSGIDLDDEVPEFEWWDNFITGFNNFIVAIVYFIIPAFIVAVVGYITNIYGNITTVVLETISQTLNVLLGGSSVSAALDIIFPAVVNLVISLAVTITVALILFVIFSFLQTMAEARLANTGSLREALNIFEAAKDIKRIGVRKVIIVIVLLIVIVGVIQMVLSTIFGYVPILSVLSIIITPYLLFFTQRAVGLLYSEIA